MDEGHWGVVADRVLVFLVLSRMLRPRVSQVFAREMLLVVEEDIRFEMAR